MAFESLLGNDRLKENLSAAIARGRISHFYLISGPAGSGKRTLAKLLAQALLCTGEKKPCGVCSHCRKVLTNNHPDFITVADPEHKNVAVRIVREARADIYVLPNEGVRKIYLFPQELGLEGQNALLKVLEEPPQYGVFILLSDNPEKLLPTVRSRCTQLQMQAVSPQILRPWLLEKCPQADSATVDAAIMRSAGFPGQALQILNQDSAVSSETQRFAQSFAARDTLALLQVLVPMERWKRDQLIGELEQWKSLLHQALASRSSIDAPSPLSRSIAASRSSAELMKAMEVLQKSMEYAQGNVSCAAICGHLEWALR